MFDNLSKIITEKIRAQIDMEDDKGELVEYGVKIVMFEFLIIPMIFIFACIVGLFWEVMIAFFVFGALRVTAGGAHCSTRKWCLIRYLLIIFGTSFTALKININFWICAVCFLFSLIMILRYSPADTAAKVINNLEKKQRLRICAVIILLMLYFMALIIKNYNTVFYNIVIMISTSVAVLIGPLGYKLLKCKRGGE